MNRVMTDVFDSINDIVWSTKPDGSRILYLNKAAEVICQRSLADFDADPSLWQVQVYPADRARVQEMFSNLAERDCAEAEWRIVRPNGEIRWLSVKARLIRDGDLQPLRVDGTASDITERKRAQAALSESERMFGLVFRASPDAISIVTIADGIFIEVNPAFERRTGYARHEIVGRSATELALWIVPEERERMVDLVHRSERVANFEVRYRTKSGEVRVALLSAEQIDFDGTPCQITIARDITDRKIAENQLRASEGKFKSIFETMQVGYFKADLADGTIVSVNPATIRLLGCDDEQDLVGHATNEFSEGGESQDQHLRHLLRSGSVENFPQQYRKRNGEILDALLNAHITYGPDGETAYLEGIILDVSEQRRTASRLAEELAFSAQLIDAVPSPIFFKDERGVYTGCNRAFEEYFGVRRAELIGTSVYDKWPKEMADVYHAADQALFDEPGTQIYEAAVKCADGSIRDVIFYKATLFSAGGELRGLVGVLLDITERKQAEEDLRNSKETLQAILDATLESLFLVDREGTILRINETAARRLGHAPNELIGANAFEEFPAEIVESRREAFDRVWRTGERVAIEDFRAGRWFSIHHYPMMDADGAVKSVVVFAMDVTERRRAEEQTRRFNQELEERVKRRTAELAAAIRELEAFSYSVSHDLRTPLRAIAGFAHILEEDYLDRLDTQGIDYLRRMSAAAERMGHLIDDLLDLSRLSRNAINVVPVDLSRIAQNVVTTYRQREPQRRVRIEIQSDVEVEADPGLMHVLFDNLIGNAWKFTANVPNAKIEFRAERVDGRYVLCVRDTGAGFDPQYADKLFMPFQRLHGAEYEGTGIGLATVHRIVTRHGGRVWAEGAVGAGAVIWFTLGQKIV